VNSTPPALTRRKKTRGTNVPRPPSYREERKSSLPPLCAQGTRPISHAQDLPVPNLAGTLSPLPIASSPPQPTPLAAATLNTMNTLLQHRYTNYYINRSKQLKHHEHIYCNKQKETTAATLGWRSWNTLTHIIATTKKQLKHYAEATETSWIYYWNNTERLLQ
jgi:hypothetical protein